MKLGPGIIDHHQPDAEPECTASLVAKYPELILDHLRASRPDEKLAPEKLMLLTHRLPDFDAIASLFLTLKLIEKTAVDPHMQKIASYTKLVDSASLPKNIDLAATPYSILRALFSGIKKDEREANLFRVDEGLKFMRFLYAKSEEGYSLDENRALFSGIDRYERAMRKCEDDYFSYLSDLSRSQKITVSLPLTGGSGRKKVDGLIIRNPRSFLLKEWARRDRDNSSLGDGFTFLMTSFMNNRYILGVDPEKGVNLKGLGGLLSQRESEKRQKEGKPLPALWYDGNCPFFNQRIVVSPQDDTCLSHGEIVSDLRAYATEKE
jgi:hypothetical protein